MSRLLKKMEYQFNKERHLHQIKIDDKWKNLTGCTTVLSVVAKPALIPWASKMAVEHIRANAKKEMLPVPEGEKATEYNYIVSEKLLEEAKSAHSKRKEKAGEWGTGTHEKIEKVITEAIKDNKGFIKAENIFDKDIKNFVDWACKNKVKFLETEKNIYSEKLFIGGIVDFVCEIDGKIWIGDIKTSNSGIYPEHFWQCAGYDLMLIEMGLYPVIGGYLILNIKENGEFNEKRSVSLSENQEAFLSCLKIYRIQEKLKNIIK